MKYNLRKPANLYLVKIRTLMASSANLYQVRENQTWIFQFCLSSFFVTHNSKAICCMWILYISNDCSAARRLPFLVWGGILATTIDYDHETVPCMWDILVRPLCGFSLFTLWKKLLENFISFRDEPEKGTETLLRWKNAGILPYICKKYTADIE